MLLCACAAPASPGTPTATQALTATPEPAQTPVVTPAVGASIPAPIRIEAGESKTIDLNGDGRIETVSILVVEDDPGAVEDETVFYFTVSDDTGKELLRQCSETLTYRAYGYIADVEGDGRAELFFCETYCSDDLITKCWRSEGEAFRELVFLEKDCVTCVSNCFGLIEDIADGGIVISAYIDVLGTRGALRRYVPDGDVYVPEAGSLWDLTRDLPVDAPETWEYYTLTVAKDLPVTIDDKEDVLPAGTQLLITGTDAKSVATFYTKDGVTGSIEIAADTVNGWGWLIEGEPEQDWFTEYLPYAG